MLPFVIRGLAMIAVAAITATGAPLAHAYKRYCASADTLMFGNRSVGSSTTAGATISNCGDEPWSFTGVSVHPSTGPAFSVASACTTGMALAPGQSCRVDVTFAPQIEGQTSGALWLNQSSTTPNQLLTFYGRGVTGTAGSAAIQFIPGVADFGPVAAGTASGLLVVTLRNVGSDPLVPSALVINGPHAYDFSEFATGDAADCAVGRAIAAGGSCKLTFAFLPETTGARVAQLVIDAPQLASLVTLQLRGVGSTPSIGTDTVDAIEYFHAATNHYFLTTEAAEATAIDAGAVGPGWMRTGQHFRAWPLPAAPTASAVDVCRFFGASGRGPDSHFFTGHATECTGLRSNDAWTYEGVAFRAQLPQNGQCAAGLDPVVRLFWNGRDVTEMRHRYVVDAALVAAMAVAGWIVEGPVFCSPR